MSVAVSHPGVYRKEIPAGPRPIEAVGTSVAAFVGSASRGPVDRAQRIVSFQEFVRNFGGIDSRSLLGYSIQHFFANGGQEAYVVRLAADNARTASVILSRALRVEARSPGDWAEEYSVEIQAESDPSRFRLAVWYTPSSEPPVVVESFDDLSILSEDSRSVTSVLGAESSFVRAAVIGSPASPPENTPAGAPEPLVGGDDGDLLVPNTVAFEGKLNPATGRSGLLLLDRIDFDLLCVPGETNPTIVAGLQKYCRGKRAFAILDSIENTAPAAMQAGPDPAVTGADALNSALYFPWVKCSDPLQENLVRDFPPCGFIAGIYARTDRARGVWKAPAGSEAGLNGATGVAPPLTDGESRILNSRGINGIRVLPGHGTVVWGSRTLHGDDRLASDWKYVPVRRLALYIEKSLFRGTRWTVFEPNDELLWARIRLDVGAFMHDLFRQGAFQGMTPRDAYFVKCDQDTTTQHDIDRGVVNIVVGFAPVKPAEFIVLEIAQSACRPVKATTVQYGASTHRLDPYKNFKFRVKWEGRYVAGVSKVARLHRATGVGEQREGAAEAGSSSPPRRLEYETVTLEHGVTYDSEFAKWAGMVWDSEVDPQGPPGDLRKDIFIDVFDEAGRLARSCKVVRCWVSESQALPDLDASANAVDIQQLKLEEEGWECDCPLDGAE